MSPDDRRPDAERHENAATAAIIAELSYRAFAITNGAVPFSDFAKPREATDFLLAPAERNFTGRG